MFSIIGFYDKNFMVKYMYTPYTIYRNKKEWYRIITHAFLHADITHLFFNMFTFFYFGLGLEKHWFRFYFYNHASIYFCTLYIGGLLASAIPAMEKQKNNPGYSAVGASGAVSAVIFSYILINPSASLYIFFLPFPIPASIFGIVYLFYSWYMSKFGIYSRNVPEFSGRNVAHDAHLWGSIFGILFTIALKPAFLIGFYNQILAMLQR